MHTRHSRSKQEIFQNLHRQLRQFDPQFPESVERLDPMVRLMLQVYSDQLSRLDERLDQTWQQASETLIRAVAPDGRRWPIPAYCVMQCQPVDPVVEVDTHTRFFYKERREGGQTLFFSGLKNERLLAAEVPLVIFVQGQHVVNLRTQASGGMSLPPPSDTDTGRIYVGVKYDGPESALARAQLFLNAADEALGLLRWGHWSPCDGSGVPVDEAEFCPGLIAKPGEVIPQREDLLNWRGMRSGRDIFAALEDHFVVLTAEFAEVWEPGPTPIPVESYLSNTTGTDFDPESELWWFCVKLPQGGDRRGLASGLQVHFNSMPVINKHELTLFKHTGGSRMVDIELPEPLDKILEISSVVDSDGEEYQADHLAAIESRSRSYVTQPRDGRMVLWFDFSDPRMSPPDALTVTYATTVGAAANGVSAGEIAQLYESHPGLGDVVNVTITRGGSPAQTIPQQLEEAALRLRGRDRAATFDQIATWTKTYDPRISRVDCENGIQRGESGLRRCVVVWCRLDIEQFHSDDEVDLLRLRLTRFLKDRSGVNTQFDVKTVSR